MNGISLVDVRAFFRWYFSQIPFVTADPADIDKHFFGFNYDEKIGGEVAGLSDVIAGLSQSTHSGLEGNIEYEGSAISEPMWLDISVVKKVKNGSFAEQEEAFDNCKSSLMDLISWMWTLRTEGDICDYPILENVDLQRITHSKITNSGGGFYGWRIRIYLFAFLDNTISFDPATAPPLWGVPEGAVAIFKDGKWTYTTSPVGWAPITFFAIAGQNSYTVADVPELEYMVGKSPKIVGLDSTNLVPAKVGWDNTNFTIDSNITLDGTEYITIIYS